MVSSPAISSQATAAVRTLTRAEHICLLVLAVALPLVEVPKNLAWVVFITLWCVNALRQRNFGSLALRWDLLFAALLAAPTLAVALSPYTRQWDELGNIVIYVSTGWALCRSQLSPKQGRELATALIGATLVGILVGLWYQAYRGRDFLELHSVGHVNHSAIYGLGVAVLAAALAMACWPRAGLRQRVLLVLVNLFLFAAMFYWASRGALVAYFAGLAMLGLPWLRAQGRRVWPVVLAVALLSALALAIHPALITKTRWLLDGGYVSSERVPAARTSIEMWRQHMLTGAGPGNFLEASPERVRDWRIGRGADFDKEDFLFSNHGHSLYFNTLAERGLIGLAALLALGIAWYAELARRRPGRAADPQAWLCWGAGVAGFIVVFAAGIFNTTLHHEHGLLAMLFLAILFGAPVTASGGALALLADQPAGA